MLQRFGLSVLGLLVLTACQPPESGQAASSIQAANHQEGVVNVVVNDTQCEPMTLTVPSGQTEFSIHNASGKKLEWEILEGVMVVDERENIAPGLSAKMTTTLLPGEYEMTCGLLSNPRGKLVVTDSGFQANNASTDMTQLAQPLADYKTYVQEEAKALVQKTAVFVAAVQAGKIDEAKAMFADVRTHYERIEPIAELFGDLDPVIDAREDDFKLGAKDPAFTGFHRIEYALWIEQSTDGVRDIAARLESDVNKLQTAIAELNFPPSKVVGGAAVLIEEVAGSKISGEENRYSRTDLSDFQANIEGAEKIVDLFRSVLAQKEPALLETVDANFKQINAILAKYKTDKGFTTYDKLTESDRQALQTPIATLAEELAKLRGTLGLN